jgi:hypothetical protein
MIKQQKEELLQRIARYLILHGSFCNNAGLLTGKTGVAIFFYHYARYTGKRIYNDFADELIDEIVKEINLEFLLNFKSGLCGIGWGITYLIQNNFVKVDLDKILAVIDKRIIEWDVRRITDYSLGAGLKGIAAYVIIRHGNYENGASFFSKNYVNDLIASLHKNGKRDMEKEQYIIGLKEQCNKLNPIFDIVEKIKYSTESVFKRSRPISIICNGYVGIGLHLMKIYRQ